MVKSGLLEAVESDPKVNPVRLTLHFTCALAIYSILINNGFEIWLNRKLVSKDIQNCAKAIRNLKIGLIMTYLTAIAGYSIFLGALVAGNRAGKIYDTFPKMGSNWIPSDYFGKRHKNMLENSLYHSPAVQLHHRILVVCFF